MAAGSYNLAFLYAAPHRQSGTPVEPNGYNTPDGTPAQGARRYDMGERNNLVALPMAEAAFALTAQWGTARVAARLAWLTERLAEAVARLACRCRTRQAAPATSSACACRAACRRG